MDKDIELIREAIRRIAGTDDSTRYPIMSGKVVGFSDDPDEQTCSVLLNVSDEDSPTDGVLLSTVTYNSNGMILTPKLNSTVIVGEVDGPGKWAVIKCSDLDQLVVIVGEYSLFLYENSMGFDGPGGNFALSHDRIQMNGGTLGGLVKLTDLVGRLNLIENDLNAIKNAFASWVVAPNDGGGALKAIAAAWAGNAITPTVNGDIENTAVKQ